MKNSKAIPKVFSQIDLSLMKSSLQRRNLVSDATTSSPRFLSQSLDLELSILKRIKKTIHLNKGSAQDFINKYSQIKDEELPDFVKNLKKVLQSSQPFSQNNPSSFNPSNIHSTYNRSSSNSSEVNFMSLSDSQWNEYKTSTRNDIQRQKNDFENINNEEEEARKEAELFIKEKTKQFEEYKLQLDESVKQAEEYLKKAEKDFLLLNLTKENVQTEIKSSAKSVNNFSNFLCLLPKIGSLQKIKNTPYDLIMKVNFSSEASQLYSEKWLKFKSLQSQHREFKLKLPDLKEKALFLSKGNEVKLTDTKSYLTFLKFRFNFFNL